MSELDEEFRHYRQGGASLSATLIALSGSLIYWQYRKLFPPSQVTTSCARYVWLQLTMLGLVIALSIGIQLAIYLGYKYQANARYKNIEKKEEKCCKEQKCCTEDGEEEWGIAQRWFTRADWFVIWATCLFVFELVLLLVQVFPWG